MAEKGKVVFAQMRRKFGFIEKSATPGQTQVELLFFHFGGYPQGQKPRIGDELEFDIVSDPGKKYPKAINLKVLSQGVSQPISSTISARQIVAKPIPVSARFVYGRQMKISGGTAIQVTVVVSRGSELLCGASVELFHNQQPVELPMKDPNTDSKGEAIFLAWLESEDQLLALSAQVTFEGRVFNFSSLYQKAEERPSVTQHPQVKPPDPEPTRLEVIVATYPDANGLFACTVNVFAEPKKVKGKFVTSSTDSLTLLATDGKTSLGTGTEVSLETESNGTKNFLLGFSSPVQAPVNFRLKNEQGKPQVKLLVKP